MTEAQQDAIRVSGLGKEYRIHRTLHPATGYSTLREVIANDTSSFLRSAVGSILGRSNPATADIESFWALRDVSFEVKRGEVLGVIGRNGAGKSTLLKILSRITAPSTGRVEVHGRIGTLLEVGTGFHPELTGRENIRLNGAILGMTQAEVRSHFDEIVYFSGVEKFIDNPVKHYSSGMQVRLAFAVAAHLDPEILIIDEVLAVGDVDFQRKCLGKMRDVAGKEGRTVIFVSHNMSAVRALCKQSILLDRGEIKCLGDSHTVIARYLEESAPRSTFRRASKADGELCIVEATGTYSPAGGAGKIELCLVVEACADVSASVDVRIKDVLGQAVAFSTVGGFNPNEIIRFVRGRNEVRIDIDGGALALGSYTISLELTDPNVRYFDRVEDCLQIAAHPIGSGGQTRVLEQNLGCGSIYLRANMTAAARRV